METAGENLRDTAVAVGDVVEARDCILLMVDECLAIRGGHINGHAGEQAGEGLSDLGCEAVAQFGWDRRSRKRELTRPGRSRVVQRDTGGS